MGGTPKIRVSFWGVCKMRIMVSSPYFGKLQFRAQSHLKTDVFERIQWGIAEYVL